MSRKTLFLSCLGFVLVGCSLLPYNGIEDDEALVAGPIFGPVAREFRLRVFHRDIPLMAMDYVGALKSWLYLPIFRLFAPSPLSLRLPVLAIGAITIWLFYLLLDRIAGNRAALAGCLLLSTDTSFLLTTEFDWGPVAIQHLMLVAACLLLVEFVRTDSRKLLAAGFFTLGLGLWDKAIFAWVLGGLVIAAVVVFPKQALARLTARNLGVAIAGLLLGVWPLVVFNARHDWRTVRNNASFSAENLDAKATVLLSTVTGSGLFGYMVNVSSAEPAREPPSWLERASTRIADFSGRPHRNVMMPALLIAFVAGLWIRASRRATLFALIFLAGAWTQMALTKNAGGGVHHAVLLWPFPQLAVAIAFAALSERWMRWGLLTFAITIAIVCAANLLVTNEYLAQFIRNGPTVTWTDAIYPLSDSIQDPSSEVFLMDWGMFQPLRMLHQGRIKIFAGFDPVMTDAPDEAQRRTIDNMLTSAQAVFIAHTPGNEVFPVPNRRFENLAATRGFSKEILRTVPDRHGRKIFEVYRFVRQ